MKPTVALTAIVALAGCGGGSTVTTVTRTTTTTVTAGVTTTVGGTVTRTPLPKPRPAAATAPTTYEQALAAVSAGTSVTMRRFQSPSGNFSCDLRVIDGVGGCELTRSTLAPESGAACDPSISDRIGRLVIEGGRASAVCNTDTFRTTLHPPVLAYGSVARAAGTTVRCLSRRIGITCVDTDNRVGFFVNTSGYTLF